jgi:hypothetical protein
VRGRSEGVDRRVFQTRFGVARNQILHSGQKVGLGRLQEQMDVIGHPHVAHHQPIELPNSRFQALQKTLKITRVAEYSLPAIATAHHVVDRSRIFNAKWSCHDRILPPRASPVNPKPGLTPSACVWAVAFLSTRTTALALLRAL